MTKMPRSAFSSRRINNLDKHLEMADRRKPIVMTATMGAKDFAWANELRQRHYPVEKNQLPAHITLFHHLPPQAIDEIAELVRKIAADHACPPCTLMDVIRFDDGVAYKLHSPQLLKIRSFFAESLHGLLVQQDQQLPRLHITIQNKVVPNESAKLFRELSNAFEQRPFEITGLSLSYYMDGPWEKIGTWRFRGRSEYS